MLALNKNFPPLTVSAFIFSLCLEESEEIHGPRTEAG
jgi:hypothetical protein